MFNVPAPNKLANFTYLLLLLNVMILSLSASQGRMSELASLGFKIESCSAHQISIGNLHFDVLRVMAHTNITCSWQCQVKRQERLPPLGKKYARLTRTSKR